MLNLTRDKELTSGIFEAMKDVTRFTFFHNSIELGIKFSPQDMKFSDMMLYSWIKDGLNGRKN